VDPQRDDHDRTRRRVIDTKTGIDSAANRPRIFHHLEASAIYTAANRDHLYAVVTGELNGVTGAIIATVTYTGGTGRFANATGTAILVGQILSDGSLEVAVHGSIDY